MPDAVGIEDDAASRAAVAFRAAREVPRAGLDAWQRAVREHAALQPGQCLIDVGAGTGGFATAFHEWFSVTVFAVEPSAPMRSLIPAQPGAVIPVEGTAEAMPLGDAAADAAWLGSVLHHLSDLGAAAREVRRVLRPGAPVLIRNTFPGRCEQDIRVRYFPQTAHSIATYPTVERVTATFAAAGFPTASITSLPQQNAPTLHAYAQGLDRASDSKLRALTDEQYDQGLARLRADARARPGEPAVSWMDLLVLR